MSALSLLAACLTVLAWGDALYSVSLWGQAGTTWVRRLGLGWLLGCVSTSWLVFLLLWLGVRLQTAVFTVSFIGVLWWGLYRAKAVPRTQWPGAGTLSQLLSRERLWRWQTLFLLIIGGQAIQVTAAALIVPMLTWDARVNWLSKALVLLTDQKLATAVYSDASRLATNLNYPLMLPLLETWFFTWLHQPSDLAVGLISSLFFLSLLLIFYDSAQLFLPTSAALGFTALLATTPWLEWLAYNGLADMPMAALVVAATMALYRWQLQVDLRGETAVLPVMPTALLLGALPWLKQEGWLWWAGLVLMFLLTQFAAWRKQKLTRRQLALTVTIIAVSVILASLWGLFLRLHGTQEFAFMPLTAHNLWLYGHRYPTILSQFGSHMASLNWNGIWLLSLGVFIWRGRQGVTAVSDLLIIPVAFFLLCVSVSYIFSRFNPYLAHLQNSLDRLLWQALPLTILWLAAQYRQWYSTYET